MNILYRLSVMAGFAFCALLAYAQKTDQREMLFDNDWKFHKGGAKGAEYLLFDDSKWRTLDLPHDWSIEDLPGTNSPFNINAVSQVDGGFTTAGTGWYRKIFKIDELQKGKNIYLQFDGVYMNADVFINGVLLGNHPYGYTSFQYDLSKNIKYGEPNVLAVKVRSEGENSRWYAGAGIFRHVWLKMLNPVHSSLWGTEITTPEVTAERALVVVKQKVDNLDKLPLSVKVITTITDGQQKELAKSESVETIESGNYRVFEHQISLDKPILWSIETPHLYSAVTEIFVLGKMVDRTQTNFGIRTLQFDLTNGFQLNGKSLKLKGACFHHDHGPLGSKSIDRAEERRVELLKASGYNAVRCTHNPPAPAFLDACDRLGMLVIDEAFDMWADAKNANDYHLYFANWWQRDLESMILRDRNHPSIIMWSIGNEIPGMDKPEVVKTAQLLADFVHKTDPSRKVTAAVNGLNPEKDPFFATLDIAGYNYGSGGDHLKNNIFDIDHQRVPSRIMFQSESYPYEAFASWMDVVDHSWMIGDFVWTAIDYIGEASIGWRGYYQNQDFFPWNLAYCGDIDICGWKRPQSYYRDALWKTNQLSIFVKPPTASFSENPNRESWSKWHWHDVVADWNWKGHENKPLEVVVYSSCEQVELFLNGKSLGKKNTARATEFKAVWQVPYQSGKIEAKGFNGKKLAQSCSLQTSGEPAQMSLLADRPEIKADGMDLCYVSLDITDKAGIKNPKAENLVEFELVGPGKIIATGNANPKSLESFQLPQRKAWQGRCLVIIQSETESGKIVLKASSKGLETKTITIETTIK